MHWRYWRIIVVLLSLSVLVFFAYGYLTDVN